METAEVVSLFFERRKGSAIIGNFCVFTKGTEHLSVGTYVFIFNKIHKCAVGYAIAARSGVAT